MFNRKKRKEMSRELEKNAEIMEQIMMNNREKRKKEDQVIDDIKKRENIFKNEKKNFFKGKLTHMSVEELHGLNFKFLSAAIPYLSSLSERVTQEELDIGQRTLGYMIRDLTSVMEQSFTASNVNEIKETIIKSIQYVHVYEPLKTGYLTVDFKLFKQNYPEDFFSLKSRPDKEDCIKTA